MHPEDRDRLALSIALLPALIALVLVVLVGAGLVNAVFPCEDDAYYEVDE